MDIWCSGFAINNFGRSKCYEIDIYMYYLNLSFLYVLPEKYACKIEENGI